MNQRALFLVVIALFSTVLARSQDYGLRFYGQEYELNKRTSLDLTSEDDFKLKDEFTLSFDLNFVPNYNSYFGYIFRIFLNEETNIDFIYENNGLSQTANLIVGDKLPLVSANFDYRDFAEWKNIQLTINTQKDFIKLQIADSTYKINNVKFSPKDRMKVFFGQNSYGRLKTTDLPNMEIKNIKVFESEKLKYNWPLDQMEGNVAYDVVDQRKAVVENPFWLYQKHLTWDLDLSQSVNGFVQAVYDSNKDRILIVSPDSLYSFSTLSSAVTKSEAYTNRINLFKGMQLYYDGISNRLVAYFVDEKQVGFYNEFTKTWSNSLPENDLGTQYFHHNKFINPKDHSLYILGGYGQLTYKNSIRKVDLQTGNWTTSINTDNVFSPRYLFGLGEYQNSDTIVIIGGYGSETGDQKINPGYWYDLIKYNPESGKFKKVYEFKKQDPEDFCFANSLIVDEKHDAYYGLVFSKHQYDGKLSLVKGSLSKPEFESLSKPIPFTFHDIMSYADLFYSSKNKKLYAVTLLHNDQNTTEVKIYSLLFPPAPRPVIASEAKSSGMLKLIILFLIAAAAAFGITFWLKRRKIVEAVSKPETAEVLSPQLHSSALLHDSQQVVEPESYENYKPEPQVVVKKKSCISLFGGFQAIDSDGTDITSQFTPLLKELFLLILLNSIQNKKGISSNRLKELLWFDKSEKDARNNQAVNMARLKVLLKKIGDIEVSKETGYWKIEVLSDDINIDYIDYLRIVGTPKHSKQQIVDLIGITNSGALLINLNFEWLDEYKSEVSNSITDTLIQFADENIKQVEPNFLIHLADVVFLFDTLNEEAMVLKCKMLVKLGKHNLAKNTFVRFCNEYKLLYNEEYSQTFNEIIE